MLQIDAFGPDATLHHIGIAVRSIQATAPELTPEFDPGQKVSVAFLELNGLTLELIEPASDDSPVSRSLKAGQRLQHMCYEVDDLDSALEVGRAAGFHALGKSVPAVAFGGRHIIWVFHNSHGLVELLQR